MKPHRQWYILPLITNLGSYFQFVYVMGKLKISVKVHYRSIPLIWPDEMGPSVRFDYSIATRLWRFVVKNVRAKYSVFFLFHVRVFSSFHHFPTPTNKVWDLSTHHAASSVSSKCKTTIAMSTQPTGNRPISELNSYMIQTGLSPIQLHQVPL